MRTGLVVVRLQPRHESSTHQFLLLPLCLVADLDPSGSCLAPARFILSMSCATLESAPSQSFHDNEQCDMQGTLLQFGWHGNLLGGKAEPVEYLPGEAHILLGLIGSSNVRRVRASVASCLREIHADVDVSSAFQGPRGLL